MLDIEIVLFLTMPQTSLQGKPEARKISNNETRYFASLNMTDGSVWGLPRPNNKASQLTRKTDTRVCLHRWIPYEGMTGFYLVKDENSSASDLVYFPGLPLPIILPSNSTTPTMFLVVAAISSSLAKAAWAGVNCFSTIFNPIFPPALMVYFRVIEGNILLVKGAV